MQNTSIMGLPADQSASVPVDTLVHAIGEKDIQTIMTVVTKEALDAPENSLKGFVNQVVKKGLRITSTLVGKLYGSRASVRFFLTLPNEPDWIQAMWFLMEKTNERGWMIAGVTKSRPTVGLFLQGRYPANMTLEHLDRDSDLEEWVQGLSPSDLSEAISNTGRGLSPEDANATWKLKKACSLNGRGVSFFENEAAERPSAVEMWMALDKNEDGSWTPTMARRRIALESFVSGMDIPWAPEEVEEYHG